MKKTCILLCMIVSISLLTIVGITPMGFDKFNLSIVIRQGLV